jgi:hypothetical protein
MNFHGCFYDLRNFCYKIVQFRAMARESKMIEIPSVSNAAQRRHMGPDKDVSGSR